MLPIEVWSMVGMHLQPPHSQKLMRVSKDTQRTVDTSAYWTRVASHLFWRSRQYKRDLYYTDPEDDGMGSFQQKVDYSPADYPWSHHPSEVRDVQDGRFAVHRATIAARHMTASESGL